MKISSHDQRLKAVVLEQVRRALGAAKTVNLDIDVSVELENAVMQTLTLKVFGFLDLPTEEPKL